MQLHGSIRLTLNNYFPASSLFFLLVYTLNPGKQPFFPFFILLFELMAGSPWPVDLFLPGAGRPAFSSCTPAPVV
jgi:hypothetical protein